MIAQPAPFSVVGGPRYLNLNCKTIGLARHDRIVHLSVVDVTGPLQSAKTGRAWYDGNAEGLDMRFEPDGDIPARSDRIQDVTGENRTGSPSFRERASQIAAFLENSVLVGHDIDFDLRMLDEEFHRAGIAWQRPPSICTLALAQRHFDFSDTKLSTIASEMGIPHQPHGVLSDALTAFRFLHLAVCSGVQVRHLSDRSNSYAREPVPAVGQHPLDPDLQPVAIHGATRRSRQRVNHDGRDSEDGPGMQWYHFVFLGLAMLALVVSFR